jgi:hypothetical protein
MSFFVISEIYCRIEPPGFIAGLFAAVLPEYKKAGHEPGFHPVCMRVQSGWFNRSALGFQSLPSWASSA